VLSCPGCSGEVSASNRSETKVNLKFAGSCFPQLTATSVSPAVESGGGRMVIAFGEEASTNAGRPPTVTVFLSASPQNPFPVISNRSTRDAKCGTDSILVVLTTLPAARIAVATRQGRPTIEAKSTP